VDITISDKRASVDPREAAALYVELGWGTAKRYSPARMKRSLEACDIVVSAHNGAGELVGIARALSDFAMDTKILDMIVAPEYQRTGVGRRMMKKIEQCARGTAIYFETEPKNVGFAKKCGYIRRTGLSVFTKRSK
jgi:GNAT superfamily N-acetyltransferase